MAGTQLAALCLFDGEPGEDAGLWKAEDKMLAAMVCQPLVFLFSFSSFSQPLLLLMSLPCFS